MKPLKGLAKHGKPGHNHSQRAEEEMREMRKELRDELEATGIAEQFDAILERTTFMRMGMLFKCWADDKNADISGIPRQE